MSKKLLAELRSLAETTSVRGIPRMMKAKTKVTFLLWFLGVLTCAALLVWQLSVVLTRYFQYPVSTVTVLAPDTPTFPDVTICNLDPSVYMDLKDVYYKNVTYQPDYLDTTRNDIAASINESFSYTQNDSPLIDVYVHDWFGVQKSIQISAAWDTRYYKCFTFRSLISDRGNINFFSAVLYVDQVDDESYAYADIYGNQLVTGLSLTVQAPGTAPNMAIATYIAAGTFTVIKLTQSVWTRLGRPYSSCTDKPYLPWDNTSAVYTQQYCVNTCIQQQIVDQCRCVTVQLSQYTMAQLRQVNYSTCEVDGTTNYYNYYDGTFEVDYDFSPSAGNCVSNILYNESLAFECSIACVLPCSEFQYDTDTSSIPWPSAASLDLYSSYFLCLPRFCSWLNISENATSEEIYNATTTPAATDFFKARFLELNIEFSSTTFVELQDVAAFSVDAMGAQIGGVLSLWLGVTVMLAIEALEFLYVYLTNCRKEEPSQTRIISVAPAVETNSSANPRRSATHRSHRSLRWGGCNRVLPRKLIKRSIKVGQNETQSEVN